MTITDEQHQTAIAYLGTCIPLSLHYAAACAFKPKQMTMAQFDKLYCYSYEFKEFCTITYDHLPSKSANFTLRLHKLVSIPKPIVKVPNQEYARDACVSGSRLLLEHNWQDKGRTFRDYLRRFMRLVLKSLGICDVEES